MVLDFGIFNLILYSKEYHLYSHETNGGNSGVAAPAVAVEGSGGRAALQGRIQNQIETRVLAPAE
jgi:hypothetical protein